MKIKTLLALILLLTNLLLFYSLPGESQTGGFQIRVDPRVELLAVIQSLTKWPDVGAFTRLEFDYYEEIKDYFKPYKKHPAVKWFDDNLIKGWNYDAPPRAMLHLTNPPDMKIAVPFTEYLTGRGNGAENLNKMVELMNRFVEESGFMKFWQDNQPFYTEFIERIKRQIPFEKYTHLMEDFYGEKKGDFVFLPVPLFHGGGYGGQLETEKGKIAHYFGGPHEVKDGFPVYSVPHLRTLVFHEFGHSFVNPVVYDNGEELDKYKEFYEVMRKTMQSMAYGDWLTVCHEHLVRTGEPFLLRAAGFPEESEENYKNNLSRGFKILPFFTEKMEEYIQQRDKYPTFRSYFPEIIKVLDEIEPVEFDVAGPMNFMMDINAERCMIKQLGKNSPLKEAGCEDGDIFETLNGKKFDGNTYFDIIEIWKKSKPGDKHKITVIRNGKKIELEVIIPPGRDYKFVRK